RLVWQGHPGSLAQLGDVATADLIIRQQPLVESIRSQVHLPLGFLLTPHLRPHSDDGHRLRTHAPLSSFRPHVVAFSPPFTKPTGGVAGLREARGVEPQRLLTLFLDNLEPYSLRPLRGFHREGHEAGLFTALLAQPRLPEERHGRLATRILAGDGAGPEVSDWHKVAGWDFLFHAEDVLGRFML